jgi:hypothetical protein
MKSSVFIGCSTEALDVAKAIQQTLVHSAYVTLWSQGVFQPSITSLESLLTSLRAHDFAIFVFTPDDRTIVRGRQYSSVRDNIIFELGLFAGKLGRERSFIVVPRSSEKRLRIPTDLVGMTPVYYEKGAQDWQAAVGPASTDIDKVIKSLGIRHHRQVNIVNKHSGLALEVRHAGLDDGDAIVQHPYNGRPQQVWDLRMVRNDVYSILSVNSGKCLEVPKGNMSDDAPVQQRQYSGDTHQKWQLTRDDSDGSFRISAMHSGKNLRVRQASQDTGAPVVQYHLVREGADEQKWWLWTVLEPA